MMLTAYPSGVSDSRPCLVLGYEQRYGSSWESELLTRLDPAGVAVRQAFTGADVLRLVETRTVHLALVSDAPRIDGLSVLRMIRSIDASLPCVLVASGPDRRWLEQALALRAESVFSPPVDLELMCRLVTRLLRERSGSPGDLA
jgi:DNA-binding NarL/FixJ family response regulator